MFFFFRKKKIVVDAFTCMYTAHEYFPIQNAIKTVPDWWKSLPKEYTTATDLGISLNLPTMKKCDGFLDLFNRGFILPLWSDVIINTQDNGYYQFQWANIKTSVIMTHDMRQYGSVISNNFTHMKIISPWVLREKTGVKFVWMNPSWNRLFSDNLNILPGVMDFKYQQDTNINILIEKKNHTYKLSAGEAMAHIIPLTDDKVEIKNHLISEQEYQQKIAHFMFTSKYKRMKQIIDGRESKCPFGFK